MRQVCRPANNAVSKCFDAYRCKESAYKIRSFLLIGFVRVLHHAQCMSSPELDELDGQHDLAGLRVALHALCSAYGSLLHLTILPANHVGRQQALCFLRMASSDEEDRIMTALGVGRFGGELVLVLNLRPTKVSHAASVAASAPATQVASRI
jgi:hypothetical protein